MLRILGSRLAATVAGLPVRVMRRLRKGCRPSSVARGSIGDLTRSRAELITENALLGQQLIVAPSGVKRASFRGHERGLLVLFARFLPRWRSMLCSWSGRRPCFDGLGPQFLIRDHDDKFGAVFDRVAKGAGARILRTRCGRRS